MDADTEEFFNLVGQRTMSCDQTVILTLIDKKTDDVLCKDLRVRCGMLHTDDETAPRCKVCESRLLLCTCGNGISLDYLGGEAMLCTNDGFCECPD